MGRAMAALRVNPQTLITEPPDAIWFPWLRTVAGLGIQPSTGSADSLEQMLHVEFAQMTLLDPGLVPLVRRGVNLLSDSERAQVREYLIEHSQMASPQLKHYLKSGAAAAAPPSGPPNVKREGGPPGPPPPTTREMAAMRRPWSP